MSDYEQHKPQYPGGEYGNKPYEPPPPSQPCPDPCDTKPRWGPPPIREECCTPHPCCTGSKKRCCTWDEVDDPCVRAASADCTTEWGKIECKCESENKKCCEEWDCGSYPKGTCVPCDPCKGLIPNPDDPGDGCDDNDIDCTSADLSKQLDALTKCISSQQGEKAKIEADIKSRQEREKELKDLIEKYDSIYDTYNAEHHKLVCREDCLKGFHRDISTVFSKYDPAYLDNLKKAINDVLCKLEMAKCCQKNLDGKLTKVTKLIWEKEQAEKELQKADKAFTIIKDLPKWMDERFKELETLKDQIAKALNDKDPESHKWAFYLFYWKFVPALCRCFPFPFCCEKKSAGSEGASQKSETPPEHLGCDPGDWLPSKITPDRLKTLICCAWDFARKKKQDAQKASDEVENAKRNLELIKKNVEEAVKALDKNLKSALNPVGKPAATSR
ncbi:MAG: hypothetical protein ACREBG_30920 [Pyrinomonadaceae bacterium]